ncbi:MAG TPA: IS4 family transposase [Bacteroidales bacterium]|nr:IS4 family transposase [Bacteroidales bacterium]
MNKGKTIFAQIMSLVNAYEFKKCVNRYNGDRHTIKFNCRDQFIVMSFAQFTDRSGLRDIETTLNLCTQDLYRSGLKAVPKSTLAEANEKKDWRIYQDFAQVLIREAKDQYVGQKLRIDLDEMVYAFDSSTIELCLKLCPWATFHHGKGAFKMHTLMDLRGSIPTFVYLTHGRVHDSKIMDKIPVESNAYYLMDKGYVKFDSLYKHFHLNNAYFVTRAKDNMVYEVLESREVDPSAGLLSDQTIRLTATTTSSKYPDTLRLVVYEDFSTGIVYRFLSNNFKLEALTIAELYRERWQIELFFKWIKQHLHIKTFYGTSMNAVFTQIWIAICDYLLLIIAKKRYMLEPSLHSISNSIGQILFKRGNIRDIFNQPAFSVNVPEGELVGQLNLW